MGKRKDVKRAEAYVERWGTPEDVCKLDVRDYERVAIEACRQGLDPAHYYYYSCSESLTLALGLGRHDLLVKPYEDPVDAWNRLDERQRAIVRAAIGDAPWMTAKPAW